MNRDLLECVCLVFAAGLVIVSIGLPHGCDSVVRAQPTQAKRPAAELKDQRKSLQESCENLMLVRLLVESELRKAEEKKKNGNRTGTTKNGSTDSRGGVGRDRSVKTPDLEVRQSSMGKVRR